MAEIRNKKELEFYLMADRMMNRGRFKESAVTWLKKHLLPDYIMLYLEALRKLSYYSHCSGIHNILFRSFWRIRHYRLGVKLGYDIGQDVLGYGVVLGHPGTIIIGASNRIGNYAVLHTSTCISNNGKRIGDGLYLSAGSVLTRQLTLGNNVQIGANSLVNKSFDKDNIMLGGAPSVVKKETQAWWLSNGDEYLKRHNEIERLKKEFGL